MFEGRCVKYDRVEIKLALSMTVTGGTIGDPQYSLQGECVAWKPIAPIGFGESETPEAGGVENDTWKKNIRLFIEQNQTGTVWQFHWRDQPGVGVDPYFITSGTDAIDEMTLEIDDYLLYSRFDGTWRLRMGEARLYLDGVLEETFSAIDIDSLGPIGPREVPVPLHFFEVFGAPYAANSVSAAAAAAEGWSYDTTLSVTGQVNGGWRFTNGGDVVTLPTNWPTVTLPSLAGASASTASVSGTNTWDTVLSVYMSDRLEDNWCMNTAFSVLSRPFRRVVAKNGRVWPLVCNTRSIGRMVTPSETLVVRGGFPQTTKSGSRTRSVSSSYFPELPGSFTSAYSTATVLSSYSELLLPMGDTVGLIEEPMTKTLYSAVYLTGSDGQSGEASVDYPWFTAGPATCGATDWRLGRIAQGDDAEFQYPARVQTRVSPDALDGNDGIIPILSHPEPIVRMYTTWHCPHWHYAPWFPADTIDTNADEIPDVQDVWKVYGTEIAVAYWLNSRQQWISHPALDEADKTKRRNIIRTEPLQEGRLLNLVKDYYFGFPSSWLGISNFEAQKPTIPASFTCTNASASLVHTITNCSVATGASIVATPLGAGTIEVGMDWSKFETAPWLFAAMSKQFKFAWSGTNVTTLSVYAEGWDGERVLICGNGDNGTWKDWPTTGNSVKFAGSWEQSFGRGYVTDDGGDDDAAGISGTTMTSTLRSTVFGLLCGRTARRIVWAVTPTAVSVVTINWPEFRFESGKVHRFVPEIAQQGCLLFPDGAGVRWGQVGYWNRGTDAFSDPPVLYGPDSMPTILDALCMRRVLFEGKSATDGLDAEIASIYDSGIEYTNVRKHMAVDPTDGGQSVHSLIVQGATGPVFLLVSSLRETPPMASYPVRDRDTDWQTTDSWVQKTWIAHERDRYYSSATGAIRLYDGAIEATNPDTNIIVPGWQVTSHSDAVTNDEATSDIIHEGTTLAHITKWHGSFAEIKALVEASGIHVTNIALQWGGFVVAWSDGAGIRVARSDFAVPLTYDSLVTVAGKQDGDQQPRLRIELALNRLWMVWTRSFVMYEAYSDDDGETWSTPVELVAAHFADTWHDERGFEGKAYFIADSGDSGPGKIKVAVREPGASAFGSYVTVAAGGSDVSFEFSSFKISAAKDEQASWILSAIKAGGTVPTNFRSFDDGATWTEL